jgi:hypothetical protein
MATEQPEVYKPTKEELRTKFFEASKPKIAEFKYNGIDLEWRQPTIQQSMNEQEGNEGKNFMVLMLISHTYVPGTNELFFEPDDYDTLCDMPLTGDFNNVTQKIAKLLDLGVDQKVGN